MKRDEDKTKEQLISELAEMHQQIAELEASETGRKQAEEALIVQRDLSMALSATSRLDEALKLCLETAISMAQMDSGSIHLVDSTSGSIDFACHQGFSPRFVEIVSHYEPNSTQARLIMAGRAIYSRHQELGLPLDEARRSEGVRALAIVPVLYEGRVIACLKTASHTLDDVPLTARATLETIATQIGSTIAHIEAEEELRESERRFRDVTENALEWVWEVDASGKYTYASPVCKKILGYKPEELLEKHFYDLLIPEEQEQLKKTAFEAFANKQPFHEFINQNIHKSGRLVWLSTSGAPILDEKGDLLGYRGADLDITERKRTEEQFQTLVNNIPLGLSLVSKKGAYDYVNTRFTDMFGYTLKDIPTGREWFEKAYPDPEYRQQVIASWLDDLGKIEIGELQHRTFTVTCKDGGSKDILFRSVTLSSGRYLITYEDITEHKQAEEALRESEEKYRTLFEDSRDAVYISTRDGKLTSANQAYLHLFGYTREEAIGMDIRKAYANPDDRLRFQQEIEQKGAVKDFELKLRKKDGTELDCLLTATVRQSKDGAILGYQGIIRDITGRKRAEEEIRKLSQFQEKVLDNANVWIDVLDEKANVVLWNKAAEEISGYSAEEVIGHGKIWKWLYPDEEYQREITAKAAAIIEREAVEHFETTIRTKDGQTRVISWNSRNLVDEDGTPTGSVALGRDITKHKRAEEAQRESEEEYRSLVGNVDVGICRVTAGTKGDFIEVNPAMSRILGYSREEFLRMNVLEMYQDPAKRKKFADKVCAQGLVKNEELKLRRKDGTPIIVSTSGTALRDEKGNIIYLDTILEDITERKRAEETLKESEEFSSSLLSDSPNPIHVINPDTSIQYVNPTLEKITGYSSAELIGRVIPYPWWPEETRDGTERDFKEALHGGMRRVEKQFQKKNGEQFWVDITFIEIKHDGKLKHYLSNWTDITERKKAEAEKMELEQQAQMASRLATVGEMASGIAHEINNPLTAVIGYTDLVLGRDLPQEVKEDVRIIHNGAKRVADIIKRLLAFARQYQPERTYLDINDIIKTTLELQAYELETSNIKVATNLAPDLPRTMADAGQLQQVFLNLIINAETEMRLAHEGGKLSVKTGAVDDTIRISFKDDGPGISKENLERIFNPFFTTREVGKGTGLGLSLCHGIIAEHNGQIYAKSKPGRGATFIVELHVITEEKQLEMAEPAEEVKKAAPARILVVDDESAICQFLKRVLTGEGHEVETVTSASDALERMKGTRYNLILLDIKLPGKSGIELYRHIKDATPTWAKRIVFITGDVMGTDTRSFLSRTRVPYITKPFDTEQLKRDISRKLTEGT